MTGKRLYILLSLFLFSIGAGWSQCIDFYDLDAPYVKCEIGPYAARTGGAAWTTRKEDSGPGDQTSRHTIHRKGVDTLTTFNGSHTGLQTVPAGEVASVRLGNRLDGYDAACLYNDCRHRNDYTGEAERITYTFRVTEDNKYLILRYAVVWENPGGHNDLLPSFQIETLLGTTGNTAISGLCYSFDKTIGNTDLDYIGNSTFNHHVCTGNTTTTIQSETHPVAWRDWRTRIINLEDYVGQTVRLRITSSDCGHKGHFGYSYFTLRCLEANLYSPTCGGPTETRTFVAPEGLNYIWYRVDAAKNRLELLSETSNRLTILNDGQRYECYIASPENANCHISLYAHAEPRLPLSSFTIDKHEDCVDTVFLTDESGVSHDGVLMAYPHENVDVVSWDLGDGRTNVIYSPGTPITYAHDGTYTIRQTTRLTNGNCVDDSVQTVTVRGRLTKHESDVYDTICSGKKYTWNGQEYSSTGTYSYTMTNAAGGGYCDSVARLHLKVWDSYFISETQDVLEGKNVPYAWHSNGAVRNLYQSGIYWDSCFSVHGCDSVYRLDLRVHPRYLIDRYDTVCCGTDYPFGSKIYNFSTAKDTLCYDSLKTKTWGNDSVYCMHLHVRPTYHFYETRYFCKGTTFSYHGRSFTEPQIYNLPYKTKAGCDSIYTLTLIENPTYLVTIDSAITDKQKPFTWHGINCPTSGTYYDSLTTVNGCDSVVRLRLKIYPTFFQEEEPITLCKDSTVRWHTKYLTGTEPGVFTVWDSLTNQYGYDSVYKAQLTVLPTYDILIKDTICEGQSVLFEGETKTTSGYYVSPIYSSIYGCDSVNRLQLTVIPKKRIHHEVHLCQGEYWTWYKTGERITSNKEVSDTLPGTAARCDSINIWHIYMHPVTNDTVRASVCQGKTYTFHGYPYTGTEAGTDTITLSGTTAYGCDSIHVLILTANPTYYEQPKQFSLCLGDYVTFNNKNYYRGGIYYDTIRTKGCGCDSAFIIKVEEHPRYFSSSTVELCKDSTLIWHGKTIRSAGTYYDSLKSVLSNDVCDSIYELIVTPRMPAYEIVAATILSTGSFSFNGQLLTEEGTYYDTLTAVSSVCDSIVELRLTVLPVYTVDTTIAICRGTKFPFNGKQLEEGGLYTEKFISRVYGTDSIVNLTLIVYEPDIRETVVHISDQESYSWYRKSNNTTTALNQSGVYDDTIPSHVTNCDSVNRLRLSVHPTYAIKDTASFCKGKSYVWQGNVYSSEGDYTAVYKTDIWNYDSVYYLHLVENPVERKEKEFNICRGEKVTFNGKIYSVGGTYYDTLKTVCCGCDSIYTIRVNEYTPFLHTENMLLCRDSVATWRGINIKANIDSVYYDSITSLLPGKCDSVYALNVRIREPEHSSLYVQILGTSSYWFNGQLLSEEGVYYDTLPAINNTCDSIIELHLTVLPVYNITVRDTICRGEEYRFNNKELENSGLYKDTLLSVHGTDSIVNLLLVVYEPRIETRNVHISDKQTPYLWTKHDGTVLPLSLGGVYDDTIRYGSLLTQCDSITRLQLAIHPTYEFRDTAYFCKGKSYTWQGNVYTTPNDYVAAYKTQQWKCDSIYYLHLIENPTYHKEYIDTLCMGGEIFFNGKTYTRGGTFYDTIKTVCCGCDSVYTIHIDEFAPFSRTETMILCKDSTTIWHGKTIRATRDTVVYDYRHSVRSGLVCDSVHALHVIVRNPEYTVLPATILSNSFYYFNGEQLNTSGIYFDTLPAINNTCDSIVELHLTVLPVYTVTIRDTICRGEKYLFNNKELENSGLYRDTLLSAYGTDSVVLLTLVVFEPRIETRNVHISDQQTYRWVLHNGTSRMLNLTGIYDDTLPSVLTQCDSISRLQLYVHPTYLFNETAVICEGETYTWRGNQYTTSNDYYDRRQTEIWHMDSIYHLSLVVNPTYAHDTTVYLCDGDYYNFNGTPVFTGGIHLDTLPTRQNCDSTFRLQIIIRPTKTIPTVASICPKDTFIWRGKEYTAKGDYTDTVRTKDNLCDSIYYTLTLKEKTTYEKTLVPVSICKGDYYDFNGRLLNETGDYTDSLTASNGCDSIVHLHLTVNDVYNLVRYDTICEGQSVLFADISRSASGPYIYSGKTKAGCDSIVTLHLTVIAKQTTYIEKHICEGDYIEIDGERIDHSGTFTEHTYSARGCDSTTIWSVSTHKPLRDTTYKSICEGQEYKFHGVTYRREGKYVHEDRSRYNCDSTYVLILTVNPVYQRDTTVELCNNEYFIYNGHRYEEGGYYQDTARTKNGCNCDSILNITVNKYPVAVVPSSKAICRGDHYYWRGKDLSAQGIYDDTVRMKTRLCDSVIYRLNLTVNNDYYEETSTAICDNSSILWRGHTYTQKGVYYDSLASVSTGCDSIYCLRLDVKPTYRFDQSVNRCDIEPYWYNGQWLDRTGDYTLRYGTKCCDCDSIYILHLRVTPTKRDTVRLNLCEGEEYDYYGKTITRSGLYYDTINRPDIQQCVISVMDIGFLKPANITNVIVEDICADNPSFQMRTYYTGTRPKVYSLVFDDKARAEGFTSVLNEPFDDVITATIPQKESGDYIRPDYYSARLTVDNDICAGATTTSYDIQLLVRYPSWIIEQNWNDAVALLNENYNGGYRFSKYAWYINGNKSTEEGSYIYLPKTLRIGDEVVVAPTRQGEDYEVPSCPITIYDKTAELIGDYPVEVAPANTQGRFILRAKVKGQYRLYSAAGALIATGSFRNGEQLTINTHTTAGCYLLQLLPFNTQPKTLKLISY